MKMNGSGLKADYVLRYWGCLSLLNWVEAITMYLFKKIGSLTRSMKFISLKVALYLYQCTIRPCMEYSYYVWAGALSCYLDLLDKLQKQVCTSVGRSPATSPELLSRRWNVDSLNLFYRYCFGRCNMNWLNLLHFFILAGGPLVILHD